MSRPNGKVAISLTNALPIEVAAERVPLETLRDQADVELGQGAVPDHLQSGQSGLAFRVWADTSGQSLYLERSDGQAVRVTLGALAGGILSALASSPTRQSRSSSTLPGPGRDGH